MERFKFHYEPTVGWINDPNGLCQYNGKYHAFFQHYPYKSEWGPMHWGHAVSEDLIHWKELEVALTPNMQYEDDGGCFSGSALVKGNVMYLFYTSVSAQFGQAQSMAFSRDGLHFDKYPGNPIICGGEQWNNKDFRDPKVFEYDGRYFMVCGGGMNGVGRILLFVSDNLTKWEYVDAIFESADYGEALECPDLFELDGKWVLVFSAIKPIKYSSVFVIGSFDGKKFLREDIQYCEAGPDFYAPQTFVDDIGRRIMIGWMYHWGKALPENVNYAGALSIPRQLHIRDGRIVNYPVAEASSLLKSQNEHVEINGMQLIVKNGTAIVNEFDISNSGVASVDKVDILADSKSVEIFINNGQLSVSQWLI